MSKSFRGLVKFVLISCSLRDGHKTAKFILKCGAETMGDSYLCNFLKAHLQCFILSDFSG